jgi:hypothetical protein
MNAVDLKFFKHDVEGKTYVGWYRLVSLTNLEVQAVGLLQRVSWDGINPEAAARYCLEDHVRRRLASGQPVPTLQDLSGGAT